jgi:acyl-CoA synthetase (AMP-forming)/AMP-acid ligase II
MQAAEPRFLDDRPTYWAEHKPDSDAVNYLGRSWTWAQWNDRIRRLAGGEMDYVLNDSGANLAHVEDVIEVTPDGGGVSGQGDQYEALLAAATPTGRPAEVDPEDTCLIMYSSGTTGRPKGVVLSQRNILAHTTNAVTFEFGPDDMNMVAMPLFHVGGSAYVQYGIHAGIPTIMTREADGASPMPPALLKSALKAWPDTDFIQVYGLTEVCGAITQLPPEAHRDESRPERMLSAGKPAREAEVWVVDPETPAEVPNGQVGELWFCTPQLMKGYHNKPDKWGESVKAVVELSAGGETSGDELIAWCRERLSHYECPRTVEISEALPRNPAGKLLKHDLRTSYWENYRGRAI